jgi:Uma2 family endonuclease
MTVQIQREKPSVLMEDVSWDYYTHTLEELGPTRGFRVVYYQGRMEIVTTSPKHERIKSIIARLLETYALEADIPITGLGQLTLRSKKLRVGLEPDECYYIQTPPPPPIEGEVDLAVYGTPDLAIEVEVSQGVIPKTPVYQALKVAEIWRYSETGITSLHRTSSGDYKPAPRSVAFPKLNLEQFSEFVAQAMQEGDHSAAKAVQAWVRRTMKKRGS